MVAEGSMHGPNLIAIQQASRAATRRAPTRRHNGGDALTGKARDKQKENKTKHTTPRIPRSSPTLVLIRRFPAYLWESGRDPEFSGSYGRMCWESHVERPTFLCPPKQATAKVCTAPMFRDLSLLSVRYSSTPMGNCATERTRQGLQVAHTVLLAVCWRLKVALLQAPVVVDDPECVLGEHAVASVEIRL